MTKSERLKQLEIAVNILARKKYYVDDDHVALLGFPKPTWGVIGPDKIYRPDDDRLLERAKEIVVEALAEALGLNDPKGSEAHVG